MNSYVLSTVCLPQLSSGGGLFDYFRRKSHARRSVRAVMDTLRASSVVDLGEGSWAEVESMVSGILASGSFNNKFLSSTFYLDGEECEVGACYSPEDNVFTLVLV